MQSLASSADQAAHFSKKQSAKQPKEKRSLINSLGPKLIYYAGFRV